MGAVTVETVVAYAERRAAQILGVGAVRWEHSAGVAKTAASLARTFDGEDAETLVAAAWLHDIGYAFDLVDTGFHPLDGARYLRTLEFPDRLCRLVANHTSAWTEAEARGLGETLASEFPAEDSIVADVLTFADLTTGPTGRPVTVQARIEEVLGRYDAGHVVHQSIRRAAPDLVATVRRVEAHLAGA